MRDGLQSSESALYQNTPVERERQRDVVGKMVGQGGRLRRNGGPVWSFSVTPRGAGVSLPIPGSSGRELAIGDRRRTVIGVAPEGFTGLFRGVAPEFWQPLDDA
ncbi:MAG: hypothetical protein OXP73_03950, partial [Chloroflexota bacterium]|nr:hypothetical protein [Chloroflexota bacterium]